MGAEFVSLKILISVVASFSCGVAWSEPMEIKSPSFTHQADIPTRYTCQGQDISPPLKFQNVPKGTKSLALIVDDPDAPDPAAPQITWVHWLVYNWPAQITKMQEGLHPLPKPAALGFNDWKKTTYGGPCPPIGRHRYIFKLYALDTLLSLRQPGKKELEAAMAGHIVGQAELVGIYKKK